MRAYRCKVKIIKYLEVVICAENKDKAKRKVPSFCMGDWGKYYYKSNRNP